MGEADPALFQALGDLRRLEGEAATPPVDYNLEALIVDEDVVALVKKQPPHIANKFLPVISSLNRLTYLGSEEEKQVMQMELELLIQKTELEIDGRST